MRRIHGGRMKRTRHLRVRRYYRSSGGRNSWPGQPRVHPWRWYAEMTTWSEDKELMLVP